MISSHIVVNVCHAENTALPTCILQSMSLTTERIKGRAAYLAATPELPYFVQCSFGSVPPVKNYSTDDLD